MEKKKADGTSQVHFILFHHGKRNFKQVKVQIICQPCGLEKNDLVCCFERQHV